MNPVTAFTGVPWLCTGAPANQEACCSQSVPVCSRRAVCRLGAALLVSTAVPVEAFVAPDGEQDSKESSGEAKKLFAEAMEKGNYEGQIADVKRNLFSMISSSDRVLEVGIGTGPNLRYLPTGTHVVGLDPNEYMGPYAMEKASENGIDLSMADGVSERLPFEDSSFDVAITTWTLCSVENPPQSIKEILRVLKPGGRFFFIEHVLADPSQPLFRAAQNALNPWRMATSNGCHLNRDTVRTMKEAKNPGFSEIKYDELNVGGPLNPFRPHVVGYARKELR